MTWVLGILVGLMLAANLYFVFKPVKYDGSVIVNTDENGHMTFLLELDTGPEDLVKSRNITFKVVYLPENTETTE